MTFVVLVATLALGWVAATNSFTGTNLVFGAAIAVAALLAVRGRISRPDILRRAIRILSLAGLFLVELVVSAIRVAVLVLRPDMARHLRPAIIAFPLTVTRDAEITLLANMITLTPGTLSIDVSDDRKVLYIHVVNVSDREALVRDIAGGFERKIIEAFK
jgi:multicomponent Na+:H+ antiporter subunit E